MPTPQDKQATPPLVSYVSMIRFMNELRDHKALPSRIDKSLMPRTSGSQISAMLAALKYLDLIDETGRPSERFTSLALASDGERKPILAAIIRSKYPFVFEAQDFDVENATSAQMAERFRTLNISGSTVTKAIAFFLAASKDADIKISAHIKAPPAPKSTNGSVKRASRRSEAAEATNAQGGGPEEFEDDEDVERFEVPIPGKASVKVIVPSDLDADDWEMLQSMITVYIKRWKGFKSNKEGS